MEELSTNEYLRGIVLNLPSSPGIYQYLNKEGVIIYVGKAKNLKRRVYSYFRKSTNQPRLVCSSARLQTSDTLSSIQKKMPCCWKIILSRNTSLAIMCY